MKRSVSLLVVLFVLGAGLVFGGAQRQGNSSGGGGGVASSTILYWANTDDTGVMRRLVEAYNATNPVQKVELVLVPGAETEVSKLMTAVRSGTGPDIYNLDRFTIGERAAGGLLEDITDYVNRVDPNYGRNFLAYAWAETQFKGRTYGIPNGTDTRAMYWRKDLFREAGIDPNILDPKNGPVDVKTLQQIANRLNVTDAQGNYTRLGFIPFATQIGQGWHYTYGYAFGGSFADVAAMKVTPTDPGVVAAFQYFYDVGKELEPQKVRTYISTYAPPNNPPQRNPFITGNLGVLVHGSWFIRDLIEYAPDVEWGVTYIPVPKAGDQSSTWAGGWSLVIPTGSKNIDGAVRFIMWMAGEQGQRLRCGFENKAYLPTWQPILSDDSLFAEQYGFVRDLLSVTKSRPVLPVGAYYWDQLSIAMEDVWTNAKTPLEALRVVETQTQAQLDRFK